MVKEVFPELERELRKMYHIPDNLPIKPERTPPGILRLSRLIKVMRLSRSLTQKKLAEMMNIPRQHLQKWEYGKVKPRPANLAKLMTMLRYENMTEVITQFYH